ncbi:hypothetical protein GCM10025771_05910 [Niveibacterium umoris]|uniref:Protein TonB n=1 Tax=Niveibacterium umoris TaxID=1193620 RepID=A0A840BJZ5_9RHOO|nr:energy transducer TonB [Niveibacterium umoris]MBB4013861.1 protein TonB [Niveibacterium umoris]
MQFALPVPTHRFWIPIAAILAHALVLWVFVVTRAPSVTMPRIASMSVSVAMAPAPQAEPAPVTPPKPLPQTNTRPTSQPQPRPVRETVVSAPASSVASNDAPAVPVAAPASPPAGGEASAEPAPVSAPRFDADYLQNPRPDYPSLSRRLGEQGRVVLRVRVEPSGAASQVELQRSSGFSRLDEAALQAVRRWKFVPARRGSEAIAEWVLVPIPFILH